MKIRTQILLAALALIIAANSTRAANIIWTNTAGGNWSDTNSWSPNQTPGSTDVAIITNSGSYTVTLDTSATVSGLTLGGASGTQIFTNSGNTFTLNGQATVGSNGQFDLSGSGAFNGNAVLNGTLNCSGGTLSGALLVSASSVLNVAAPGLSFNDNILTNSGTLAWSAGDLTGDASPQIYNYGLWNAQSDNSIFGEHTTGKTTFINFGTFRKSAGTGTTTLDGDTTFNNTGTLDIQSGTLTIQKGIGSGICNIASGAIFSPSGNYTFTNSTTFSGAGVISGFLIGNNAVLNGTLTSSGVTMSGSLTLSSNTMLNIAGSGLTINGFYSGFAALTNYGTVVWTNAILHGDYSPQIYNYGLWNAQADSTFVGEGSTGNTIFNNFGTFRKSAGSGTTTMDGNTIFNNTGALDIQSGTLAIQTGSGSGTCNIAAGAVLSLNSNYTLTNSTTFSGSGSINGFLIGNNAVLNGTLTASGATMSGVLTLASNAVLNVGTSGLAVNGFYAGVATLTNLGTVAWTNGSLNGDYSPQIYNYGLWNAQADNTFVGQGSSGTTTFNNFGTFRKSAGSGTTTLNGTTVFNNTGALDIESGTLAIQTGSGSGTCNITNGAIFSPGSGYTFTSNTTFSGAGVTSGLLTGNNAVLSGVLTASGATAYGTLTLASNSVLNIGAAGLNFNGSILTNYGTVTWSAATNLTGDVSPQIYNYGLWDAQSDNSFFGHQTSGNTTFINFGTFRKSAGSGTTTLDGNTTFNNSGALDVESGTLAIQTGGGSGTCNIASGAIFSPGSYLLTNSTTFSGSGFVSGLFIGNNALLIGTLTSSGATMSGTLTLASNTVLNISTSGLKVNGSPSPAFLTNYGTVSWSAGTLVGDNSPQIFNYGLWNAQSNNTFSGQQSTGTTTFNNFGTFRKSSATGTTIIGDFMNFKNTGLLDVQSGTVNFTGNPTLVGGTVNFGINSLNSFGKITYSSGATLAGTLSVNLNNLFAPTTNNSFAVMTYSSQNGAFTNFILPSLPGLIWQTNYGSTTFTLSVTNIASFSLSSTATTVSGGAFSFSFGTVPGQTYQIQSTTNLAPANWVTNLTFQATNSSITFSNLINGNPQLFYRAVLQQ
jgi:hypothetical protein